MRINRRDVISTLFVVLIAVPYVGYLVTGSMPFVEDPRGMSAIGLVLGVAAFLVADRGAATIQRRTIERVLGVVSLAVGVAALVLAETAAAEALLAVFMVTISVVWAAQMFDHARVPASTGRGSGLAHS